MYIDNTALHTTAIYYSQWRSTTIQVNEINCVARSLLPTDSRNICAIPNTVIIIKAVPSTFSYDKQTIIYHIYLHTRARSPIEESTAQYMV